MKVWYLSLVSPNHIPLLSTNRGEQRGLPRQDRGGEERDHLEQRDGGHLP